MHTAELMGGWEATVADAMGKITRGVPGAEDVSATWVKNLHLQYVALLHKGYAAPEYVTAAGDAAAQRMLIALKAASGYNAPLVRAFLVSLYTLKQAAKIPPSKYDPITTAAQQDIKGKLDPGFWDKAGGGLKTALGLGTLGTLAAVGVAAYLLTRKG